MAGKPCNGCTGGTKLSGTPGLPIYLYPSCLLAVCLSVCLSVCLIPRPLMPSAVPEQSMRNACMPTYETPGIPLSCLLGTELLLPCRLPCPALIWETDDVSGLVQHAQCQRGRHTPQHNTPRTLLSCFMSLILYVPAGPLPWDDLSSSEDEFSPRPRHARPLAEELPHANGASPRAGANGVSKAPAPDSSLEAAKSPRAGKGMSLADQIAFGAKTAQDLLQVCFTPFCSLPCVVGLAFALCSWVCVLCLVLFAFRALSSVLCFFAVVFCSLPRAICLAFFALCSLLCVCVAFCSPSSSVSFQPPACNHAAFLCT